MSPAWINAERVLGVRLDYLGDVLMTGPALRALKEQRPERKVSLLTSSGGAHAAELIREVDDTLVYDAPWMKNQSGSHEAQHDWNLIHEIKRMNFDAAVIFTVYSQSALPAALFCLLCNIPLRLAYSRENPYHLLTDWVPETEPQQTIRHEVRRQLDLVSQVGATVSDEAMHISISDIARRKAEWFLTNQGIDLESPWLILHPGASALSRRYSPERFADAVSSLMEQFGLQVILTGQRQEEEVLEHVRRRCKFGLPSLCDLDLEVLAAVIEKADLLICNNTGPAHIAAAVGTPVVDLYALTNPQHTPWMVPSAVLYHDVPCKYCYKSVCPERHHHCLELVQPDEIVRSAVSLLSKTGRRRLKRPMEVRKTNSDAMNRRRPHVDARY